MQQVKNSNTLTNTVSFKIEVADSNVGSENEINTLEKGFKHYNYQVVLYMTPGKNVEKQGSKN